MLYKITPSHILYKINVDHDLHIPFLVVFSSTILLTKYESNSRFVYFKFKYLHQFRKKPTFSKIAHHSILQYFLKIYHKSQCPFPLSSCHLPLVSCLFALDSRRLTTLSLFYLSFPCLVLPYLLP